jgi:hypothetical protein
MPRERAFLDGIVLGAPDSARVLGGRAADSVLRLSRAGDMYLESRDVERRRSRNRTFLGLGAGVLAAVSAIVAAETGEIWLLVPAIGGAVASLYFLQESSAPLARAEARQVDAIEVHRDAVAAAILARRGLAPRDPSSSTPSLGDCSWESCRLATRTTLLGHTVTVGRSDPERIGLWGDDFSRHVTRVPAAASAARRFVTARRTSLLLTVGAGLTLLVLGNDATPATTAGLVGVGAVGVWQGVRAKSALEDAVWLYNRELLR